MTILIIGYLIVLLFFFQIRILWRSWFQVVKSILMLIDVIYLGSLELIDDLVIILFIDLGIAFHKFKEIGFDLVVSGQIAGVGLQQILCQVIDSQSAASNIVDCHFFWVTHTVKTDLITNIRIIFQFW